MRVSGTIERNVIRRETSDRGDDCHELLSNAVYGSR